jgi:DNA polymerase III delta prime subunit
MNIANKKLKLWELNRVSESEYKEQAKIPVIIVLDDIDFINEQSQQVFRNCIDKYSHNVHFICSCTNSQKVIESLQYRLIIIKIKPLDRTHLVNIMIKIKETEDDIDFLKD